MTHTGEVSPGGQRALNVVLGVSGGIAAYKACLLLRLFTEAGHDVTVVPTEAALRFVGAPTWAALSGKPVPSDLWADVHQVPHVRIGQQADLVVVAPATADLLAQAAAGLAGDLLTNTLLTAACPVVFAPAMHTEMWEHAATRANVATLRERGAHVIEPASGRLTGADSGAGRLPEPADIFEAALAVISATTSPDAAGRRPLDGVRFVVSAGGTRENLDPVRFIGNRSSGKQGYAIARAAQARGAEVTLVAANVELPTPDGVTLVRVETTAQLKEAVDAASASADVVVMAAAPADFRPASASEHKIKKKPGHDAGAAGEPERLRLELVENPDIVKGLVADRTRRGSARPMIVSFAAETGDADGSVMDHARAKFERKGSDLQVVNEVGPGVTFGQDDSTVHLMRRGDDDVRTVGPAPKAAVAEAVVDLIQSVLAGSVDSPGGQPTAHPLSP